MDWKNRIFVATSKQVETEFGIIVKAENSIANSHIESVRYGQGVIGGIFNYGDVYVESAAKGEDLIFVAIESPKMRANQIQDQIRYYRSLHNMNHNVSMK